MATPLTSADSERRIRRRRPGGRAWSRRRPVVASPLPGDAVGQALLLLPFGTRGSRGPGLAAARFTGERRSRRSSRPASAKETAGEKKEQREELRRTRGCRQPPAALQIWPPPVTWRSRPRVQQNGRSGGAKNANPVTVSAGTRRVDRETREGRGDGRGPVRKRDGKHASASRRWRRCGRGRTGGGSTRRFH
ncbi:hypothetical protein MTO96_003214 [Rhipicephalus appendiculatus]